MDDPNEARWSHFSPATRRVLARAEEALREAARSRAELADAVRAGWLLLGRPPCQVAVPCSRSG